MGYEIDQRLRRTGLGVNGWAPLGYGLFGSLWGVEAALARKNPSALTPQAKMVRPMAATGIKALDEVLRGGLPIGAVSELVGPECSGRTSSALSFLAQLTQAGKV
jgi:hypothetical protein